MQYPCVNFDLCAKEAGWEDSSMRISAEREQFLFTLAATPRLAHHPGPLLRHN